MVDRRGDAQSGVFGAFEIPGAPCARTATPGSLPTSSSTPTGNLAEAPLSIYRVSGGKWVLQ